MWMEQLGALPDHTPLPGDRQVDVAIAGGGFTGLWTAFYLKTLDPSLEICVLESEYCGFGASGRNGGWMMAALEVEVDLLASLDGERAVQARAAIHGILPEVERVLRDFEIDCDFVQGGGIYAAARYPEQERRVRADLEAYYAAGFSPEDFRWLDRTELVERLAIAQPRGAIFTPHVARIHPAKLVSGLLCAVRSLGVTVYERTRVQGVDQGAFVTDRGRVSASHRVLALEGYSGSLALLRRRVLPIQSRVIATEPLGIDLWQQLGLAGREVFCDGGPLVTYGQRSEDGRLVFGARGSYQFGGRVRSEFRHDTAAFEQVHRLLLACLPQLGGVAITHRWGGNLGIPRVGRPHAVLDPVTGLATAGGYFGEGVGASNLMARTLADLILQRDTPLVQAPWVRLASTEKALRRWEPEPLRWLGYKSIDLVQNWEERVYRRHGAPWQVNALRKISQLLDRLLS